MNDMTAVTAPRTDQINADTLISGPMTVTVKDVKISGGTEQPVTISLEETPLLYRPCKSMSRILVAVWGPDAKKYAGRSMTLYRDPTVKWGGMDVGGIRISHLSHIDSAFTMALTATRASRKPFTVKPLAIEQAPAKKPATPERTVEESEKLLRAAASITNGTATQRLGEMWATLSKDHKAALKPLLDAQLKAQAKAADAEKAPPATAQEPVKDSFVAAYDSAPGPEDVS